MTEKTKINESVQESDRDTITESILEGVSISDSKDSDSDPKSIERQRRIRMEQVKTYILTFLAFSFIYVQRKFWGMSKPLIKADPVLGGPLNADTLSNFDQTQLWF